MVSGWGRRAFLHSAAPSLADKRIPPALPCLAVRLTRKNPSKSECGAVMSQVDARILGLDLWAVRANAL